METNLKIALERIWELEEQLKDQTVLADLAEARAEDVEAELKAAKGQLALLKQDCRYVA